MHNNTINKNIISLLLLSIQFVYGLGFRVNKKMKNKEKKILRNPTKLATAIAEVYVHLMKV